MAQPIHHDIGNRYFFGEFRGNDFSAATLVSTFPRTIGKFLTEKLVPLGQPAAAVDMMEPPIQRWRILPHAISQFTYWFTFSRLPTRTHQSFSKVIPYSAVEVSMMSVKPGRRSRNFNTHDKVTADREREPSMIASLRLNNADRLMPSVIGWTLIS